MVVDKGKLRSTGLRINDEPGTSIRSAEDEIKRTFEFHVNGWGKICSAGLEFERKQKASNMIMYDHIEDGTKVVANTYDVNGEYDFLIIQDKKYVRVSTYKDQGLVVSCGDISKTKPIDQKRIKLLINNVNGDIANISAALTAMPEIQKMFDKYVPKSPIDMQICLLELGPTQVEFDEFVQTFMSGKGSK